MNDGLGLEKPGGSKLYLNTFGGQFRSRVTPKNPPIPGAEVQTRITAKGKELTECLIYSIEGVISSIHTNTKVNGSMTFNEFVINLKHESGKDYVLTFNQTSSDTFDILNRILNPSFNPSKKVKLVPYMFEKENKPGKYNQGVVLYQNASGRDFSNEDKIEKFVVGKDKAAELGVPPWEKQQTDTGVVYLKRPQLNWFMKKVMDKVVSSGGRIESRKDGDKQVSYLVFPSTQASFEGTQPSPQQQYNEDPLAQSHAHQGPSAADQARMLHGEPRQPQRTAPQYEEEDEDDLPF